VLEIHGGKGLIVDDSELLDRRIIKSWQDPHFDSAARQGCRVVDRLWRLFPCHVLRLAASEEDRYSDAECKTAFYQISRSHSMFSKVMDWMHIVHSPRKSNNHGNWVVL